MSDELRERLEKAETELLLLEQQAFGENRVRLEGKRQGVKLALSYLREEARRG